MSLALLLLETSLLVHPLHLGAAPPELRAARNILLVDAETEDGPQGTRLPAATNLELARTLVARARAGEPFDALAAEHSHDPGASSGAVLGVFARGMLAPELDAFLFSADLDAISEPLAVTGGVQILQRVDVQAGARHILFRGEADAARARCREAQARLARGESFADLARELSDDEASAARGGLIGVYERGREDRLLKRATFDAAPNEVVGPIETPLGLHLVQRVPVEGIDPALFEDNWIRARAILIRRSTETPSGTGASRSSDEAERLARELHRRVVEGEDMEALAREHDEDPGGRARGGDLGWLHRQAPGLPRFLERLFVAEPGVIQEPFPTAEGWVLVRRER